MEFIAGRIEGKTVDCYSSEPAIVSSRDLWWRLSPLRKSDFCPKRMVSELFFRVLIYLRLLLFPAPDLLGKRFS